MPKVVDADSTIRVVDGRAFAEESEELSYIEIERQIGLYTSRLADFNGKVIGTQSIITKLEDALSQMTPPIREIE